MCTRRGREIFDILRIVFSRVVNYCAVYVYIMMGTCLEIFFRTRFVKIMISTTYLYCSATNSVRELKFRSG